jgi:hypothetical protein
MASLRSSIDTVINIRDNFIFTVSSMNPPTPGHVGVLIKRMMELALDMGEQNVYVFFGSRKYDTIEYPLSCEDRETALNYMITRLKSLDPKLGSVNVIFMYEEDQNNGLLYFGKKINQYFSIAPGKTKQINGFFVAGGDDRLEMIKNVRSIVRPELRQHFKNDIEQVHLKRDEGRNAKLDSGVFNPNDLSQISSTIVNKFVDSGNEKGFAAIYNHWLPLEQIGWLWNRLKAVRVKGPGTVSGADLRFSSMGSKTGTLMGHNPNFGGKRRRTIRRKNKSNKRKTMRKRRKDKSNKRKTIRKRR